MSRIVSPAPPKGERPLCLYCGKELRPRYSDRVSDGAERLAPGYNARSLAGDKTVKRWDGTWEGFPYQTPGRPIPTHCKPACAASHGAVLARKLIESKEHGVVLTEEGIRRAEHCRPSELATIAKDVIS